MISKDLPDGVTEDDIEIVSVAIQDDQGRILLVRRPKSDEVHPGWWEVPGGHRNEDDDGGWSETIEEAGLREMREEVGLAHATLVKGHRSYFTLQDKEGHYGVMLHAKVGKSKLVRLRLKEHDGLVWVDPEQVSVFKPTYDDFVENVMTALGVTKTSKKGSVTMRRTAEKQKRDYDAVRDVENTQAVFQSLENPSWESVFLMGNLRAPDRENFSAKQEPTKSMALLDHQCGYGVKDENISVFHVIRDALRDADAIEECEATMESEKTASVRTYHPRTTPHIASLLRKAGLKVHVSGPRTIQASLPARDNGPHPVKKTAARVAESGFVADIEALRKLSGCTITVKEKKGESIPADVKTDAEAVMEWEECPEGCFFATAKDNKRDIFEWASHSTKEGALALLRDHLKPLFAVHYPEIKVTASRRITLFAPKRTAAESPPAPPAPAAPPPGQAPNAPANSGAKAPTKLTLEQANVQSPADTLKKVVPPDTKIQPNIGQGTIQVETNQPQVVIPQLQQAITQNNMPFKLASLRRVATLLRRRYSGYPWFKGVSLGSIRRGGRAACGCANMHVEDHGDLPHDLPTSMDTIPIKLVIIQMKPAETHDESHDLPLDSIFEQLSHDAEPIRDEFDLPSGCDSEEDEYTTVEELFDDNGPPNEMDQLLEQAHKDHHELPPMPPTAGRRASSKISIRMGVARPRVASTVVPEMDSRIGTPRTRARQRTPFRSS